MMGLFNKSQKVKDAQYYSGVAFASYGMYIVKNWPTSSMQERLGSYFKSIVDFYDMQSNGTYYSNLFSLGCQGKVFNSKWNTEEVKQILNNSQADLKAVKDALEEFTFRKGPDKDIARALYKCIGVDPSSKSNDKDELVSWLVMCVYNTVLDRATLKRPRDERNDSYPEAVVSSLFGGLMLCCYRELVK
jgi:hypothetical protein